MNDSCRTGGIRNSHIYLGWTVTDPYSIVHSQFDTKTKPLFIPIDRLNKTTLKILTQDFRVNKRWLFPFRLHVRQIWGPNWVFEMEPAVVFASVECSDRIFPVKLWKICDKNQSLGNSRGFHIEILCVTYDLVNQHTLTKFPSLLWPVLAEILFQIVPSNGTLICNTVSFFLSPLMLLSPVAPLVSFCSSSFLNLKKNTMYNQF